MIHKEEDKINRQDFGEGLLAWDEYRRKKAIIAMFKRKSFNDEFDELKWFQKPFYWFKTIICLLFKRTGGSYLGDSVCIISWDFHPSVGEYYGQDWTSCWVETGFFKNWKVCICSDSSY